MPTAYKSPHLDGAQVATVIARVAKVGGRTANLDHRFQVDIYRYDPGCPNISFRMTSSGYAGTVWIKERPREFVVPAGRRIVLKGGWLQDNGSVKSSCTSVLAFRPENGATYLYEYAEPSNQTCASNLVELDLPDGPEGKPEMAPVESLTHVRTKMGFWGYTADELCTLPP
ncbi:MAG TPA: hypothetical protein VF550_18020 [Polyangia bacterium]